MAQFGSLAKLTHHQGQTESVDSLHHQITKIFNKCICEAAEDVQYFVNNGRSSVWDFSGADSLWLMILLRRIFRG